MAGLPEGAVAPLAIESGLFSEVMPSRINALFAERYIILDRFIERGGVEEGSAEALAFIDINNTEAFNKVAGRPDFVQEAEVLHQQVVIDGFRRIFGTEVAERILVGRSSPQTKPSSFKKPVYKGELPATLEDAGMKDSFHDLLELHGGQHGFSFLTALPKEVMAKYADIGVYLEPRYYSAAKTDQPETWTFNVNALPITVPDNGKVYEDGQGEVQQRRDEVIARAERWFTPSDLDQQLSESERGVVYQALEWVNVADPWEPSRTVQVRPKLTYVIGTDRYDTGLYEILIAQRFEGVDHDCHRGELEFVRKDGKMLRAPRMRVNTGRTKDGTHGVLVPLDSQDAANLLELANAALTAQP
jgi:hypothetical protein